MMNTFGERLKELRIEKKIGQVELAKELGVSKGIELREPKLSNLIVLSNYFKVSIDYLAGIEE